MMEVTVEIPDWIVDECLTWLKRNIHQYYQGEERNDEEQEALVRDIDRLLAGEDQERRAELTEWLAADLMNEIDRNTVQRFRSDRKTVDHIFYVLGYV